jgi:hypothetical protein
VAVVAILPFLRGVLTGQSLYFRDLSRQFFPLRRFAVEGLLRGELRYWNPFLHEGEPLSLPPLSYPFDLLQLLFRDEAGFSFLLALHVPLGALAFMALAKRLGASRTSAAGGALVYALGGFYLSTMNLYVYLQAAAWAPWVVSGLLRSAEGSVRGRVAGAILVALALSTTGAEIVLQAILVGAVFAFSRRESIRLARVATSVALGFGLAGPTLAAMRNAVAGSARAEGFPTDVVLAQSIHPLTLLQVLVGNLLGDLLNLPNRWWGENFFPLGFPYVLSLYLGAAVMAVAVVGALHGATMRARVTLLAVLAVAASIGRWAGLATLVDALPLLRLFRFPSKVFFTCHLSVAVLVALGLDRLRGGHPRVAWRTLAAVSLGLGGLLTAAPALPHVFPAFTRWFLAGFLPPSYSLPERLATGGAILSDAAVGGWIVGALGLVALLVLADRLEARKAALVPLALMTTDLLRTGAGLNPMATASFYRLSPQMSRVVAEIRRGGGRAFTCDPASGPAYFDARRYHVDHDAWTFAVLMETLTPAFNVSFGVPTAYSRDLTMLVPVERVLSMDELGPGAFEAIADRVRRAGVAVVVSPDPVSSPALRLREVSRPARTAPLAIHVYDLDRPLPLRALARAVRAVASPTEAIEVASQPGFQESGGVAVEGMLQPVAGAEGQALVVRDGAERIEMQVVADRPSVVVVRDAFAPGWSATVNGERAPVLRADGRHRAVPVPAGTSRVLLSYRPPGLAGGLLAAAASALLLLSLGRLSRVRKERSGRGPSGND